MQEFKEISSQYQIEAKEDSEQISSNGEFERADKMEVYDEEDTELAKIEAAKVWQKTNNTRTMNAPRAVLEAAAKEKADGVKSRRQKGFKHFNQVGFIGADFKEVPRWAATSDAIKKVL